MVSVTKAPTWGQTRGCLEEQRMRAIEGGVGDDIVSGRGCREDVWAAFLRE